MSIPGFAVLWRLSCRCSRKTGALISDQRWILPLVLILLIGGLILVGRDLASGAGPIAAGGTLPLPVVTEESAPPPVVLTPAEVPGTVSIGRRQRPSDGPSTRRSPAEIRRAVGLLLLWDDFDAAEALWIRQSATLGAAGTLQRQQHQDLLTALPDALLDEAAALVTATADWDLLAWQRAFVEQFPEAEERARHLDLLQQAILRRPPQLTLQQAAFLLPPRLAAAFVSNLHLRLRQATAADDHLIRLLAQHGLAADSPQQAAYWQSVPRRRQDYIPAPAPIPAPVSEDLGP